jgi:hypothetical protein
VRSYRIPLDKLDLSDPERSRLTCSVEELQALHMEGSLAALRLTTARLLVVRRWTLRSRSLPMVGESYLIQGKLPL